MISLSAPIHPCPECNGGLQWYARECGYCRHRLSFAERCEWLPEWAGFVAAVAMATVGAVMLHLLLCWIGLY